MNSVGVGMGLGWGKDDRWAKTTVPSPQGIRYLSGKAELAVWIPLVLAGRETTQAVSKPNQSKPPFSRDTELHHAERW